ncbi:MAG: hypothetical protein Q8J69_04105 [Sphingobacteriaceae bacterium]|nr:hypothetical protein [Sphingobacteriaceae bacterium]
MEIKIGDVVTRKGFRQELSVHGFLVERGASINLNTTSTQSEWVVCQYWAPEAEVYKYEVFHRDQLEPASDEDDDFFS